MKLLSIEINNFRQFFGPHHLELGLQANKNIIVIHGENGSGKTTLLNAFKWCFYGQTDFDSLNENLLNERCVAESSAGSKINMSVTVEFEHENMRHTAKRESIFKKTANLSYESIGGSVFSLTWIDTGGGFQESKNADTHMSQILPEKMQPYFFFNGERIEKLAHINAADQIQSAIKNLMGLEIVERASHHLGGAVITKLRKELKETSSKDLADVIENETAFAEKVEEIKREVVQIEKNVIEFKEELQLVNRAFETNYEVSSLHKERTTLEAEIGTCQEKIAVLKKDRRDYLSAMGCLAFTDSLLKTSGDILNEKRLKGELPFKVKEQFITDLLDEGRCICSRSLEIGSAPYDAVHSFKSSTTPADVENAFIETSTHIVQMTRAKVDLFHRLAGFQRDESDYNIEIVKKQGRIDVITKSIGDRRDSEDITKLETKRGEILQELDNFASKRGALQTNLADWELKYAEIKKEREKLSLQNAKGDVATRRLKLAEEVLQVIDSLYLALAEQVRDRLSAKVDATFKSIMRKPYWAEISKDYTLQIYKEIGGHKQIVYEKSTGENQITSLSFVGSIVSIAKERSDSDNDNFKGGVFPIVMDSPFGALDPDYRTKVAEYIPELAEQVVLMVSDSQWSGQVEKQVRPRMAREYSLHYSRPSDQKPLDTEGLKSGERYECTEIKEGFHVQ
jgi:DNA sulfur modification protein DndD